MNNGDRIFCVKAVDTEESVAELLTNHYWPLCMGFEHEGFLYINDGDREDSPEYAAIYLQKLDGINAEGREVGRLVPDTDTSKAYDFVHGIRRGRWSVDSPIKFKVEPDWHHSCDLCAFNEE
jgi:hypothetical protein